MRILFWIAVLLVVIGATPAFAQIQLTYAADWYFIGASEPFTSSGVIADETNCDPNGILPPVPNNVVNPGTMWWSHDPDLIVVGTELNDGPLPPWICSVDVTALVRPFPRGTYFSRIRAIDLMAPVGENTSADSANSNPFGSAGVPVAPGAPVIRN